MNRSRPESLTEVIYPWSGPNEDVMSPESIARLSFHHRYQFQSRDDLLSQVHDRMWANMNNLRVASDAW